MAEVHVSPDHSNNIIDQIIIHPQVEASWFDVLTDISRTMSGIYKGTIIDFSPDSAMVNPAGILELVAYVAGERVVMELPEGTWKRIAK